jgi:hypothetical protein
MPRSRRMCMLAEFFPLVDNHWDVFVETRAALWSP